MHRRTVQAKRRFKMELFTRKYFAGSIDFSVRSRGKVSFLPLWAPVHVTKSSSFADESPWDERRHLIGEHFCANQIRAILVRLSIRLLCLVTPLPYCLMAAIE